MRTYFYSYRVLGLFTHSRALRSKLMRLLFVVALLLCSSETSASNINFLQGKTVIGCENEEGYPPFIYADSTGEMRGYSVDLIDLIFENSGAETIYRLVPWKRCLAEIGKGEKSDIALAAVDTKERREKYLFSDAFAEVHLAYFYDRVKYPNGLDIKVPNDFEKYHVGGMAGFEYDNYGIPNEIYQSASTFQQLVEQTIRSRVDILLARYEVFNSLFKADPYFKNNNRMRGEKIPWRKTHPIQFFFIARKGSAYHEKLIDFINMRMKEIDKSGQLNKIKKRYGFVTDKNRD